MRHTFRDRSGSLQTALYVLIAGAFVGQLFFFGTRWMGDAVVHLVYAANAAAGRWFQFNPHQVTQGSTSLLWTAILALYWRLFGAVGTSWADSITCMIAFGVATVLTLSLGRRVAGTTAALLAGLLFVANPSIGVNGLEGMESTLGAVLVVSGFLSVFARPWRAWTPWAWGVLAGLSFLCRPDAAVPVTVQAVYALWRARAESPSVHPPLRRVVSFALPAFVTAIALIVPAFVFQHRVTGHWLPSSGVSRVLLSRRTAWHLGPLWIHGRLLTRLLVPYLPVSLGCAWAGVLAWRERRHELLALCTSVGVTLAMHTFVTGATHASRYFIITFPAYYVTGVVGLGDLFDRMAHWPLPRRLVAALPTLTVLWFVAVYSADIALRVRMVALGGPASMDLYLYKDRHNATNGLLAKIGWTGRYPVRLALTEVQLRRYLDDRLWLQSLDGRVDQELLDVTPHSTGCPDYGTYLRLVHADYVMSDQACDCPTSLLCRLQQELDHVTPKGAPQVVTLDGLRFTSTGYWKIWQVTDLTRPD